MFNKKYTDSDLKEYVKEYKDKISGLEKELSESKKDHDKEILNIEKDHEITLNRKQAEIDITVSEKTKTLTDELQKTKIESANYKKEVEILTKAFENLGFDVKDMKDILNKLVDGIVSKNQIQLIGQK